MNENIGAKGGLQDRKRILRIKRKNLAKIKRKKQKEETNLKVNDIKVFLKILPIIILGESFKVVLKNTKKQKNSPLSINQQNIKNIKAKEKKVIKVAKKEIPPIITTIKIKKIEKKEYPRQINEKTTFINKDVPIKINNNTNYEEKEDFDQNLIFKTNTTNNKRIVTFSLSPITLKKLKLPSNPKKKTNFETKYLQFKEKKTTTSKKDNNNKKQKKTRSKKQEKQNKINRIIDIKIIDEYTKKLYDVRYSLKKLIYEYNTLVVESDEIYTKKEIEMLLYKLNIIIRKIEELKEKIKIEDINKYDDSYIYNLVNEYLKEFENKNFIDEIKNSDLYITLSEKIQELDTEKEKLETKLELRKEKIDSDNKNFETIKKEYEIFAKFDQDLINFQNEQIYLLKELESNIENSLTITEKVEKEVIAMNNQCKKLLELIALQMMIPKLKSAKNIITSTIIYMYYMRKILQPEIKTKKYKIIKITDYSKDIENSIYQIDNITDKLEKTSKKLNGMIKDFEEKYQEYFDVIPECKNLLNNLKSILNSLKEKEHEINRLKQQQRKNLEINNEKVKRLNNKVEMIPQKKSS